VVRHLVPCISVITGTEPDISGTGDGHPGFVGQEVIAHSVESGLLHSGLRFGILHEGVPYELRALVFCH
jgi:hypothetical protein